MALVFSEEGREAAASRSFRRSRRNQARKSEDLPVVAAHRP